MSLDIQRTDGFAPVDPKSFKQDKVELSLTNMTSRLEVSRREISANKKKEGKGKFESSGQILEIEGDALNLEVPANFCAIGHHIFLKIDLTYHSQRVSFTSTARVLNYKQTASSRAEITVSLLQFDRTTWNILLQILGKRQTEVSEFLAFAKGHC